MNIQEIIQEKVVAAARALYKDADTNHITVIPAETFAHGDYATNAALVLSRIVGLPPREVAEALRARMLEDADISTLISRIDTAGPGFLNIILSDACLLTGLRKVIQDGDRWGHSEKGKGQTAMVEYFQLNIAKRPHIGHLRSAVIGDALKRLLLSQGYQTVSDTHVGDWGTQFGILLLGYKDFIRGEGEKKDVEKDPFAVLEDIYAKENATIEKDPSRRDYAKEEFAKLERGDAENRDIWAWMVDVSMWKLHESADRLGLLPFDEHKGESSYEADMPHIVEAALKKGIAITKDDGAIVVDLTSEKLDEAVLVKSDGASTYLLRDLATIQYRKERWNFWKNLYVVDVRQSHHFQQLFRVAELLGYEGVGASEHVSLGFMKLPEGPMSTRKGTAIALETLLDESEKRAREIIQEKNPDLEHPDEVARMVGLGAIKYFDLSHHRVSDVVFSWEHALSFEGNTGPYMQYTYARLRNILNKVGGDVVVPEHAVFDEIEHRICVSLLRLPESIEQAISLWSPHVLAAYVYNLTQIANEFYHARPVLQEEQETKRALRLALVSAAASTIKNSLHLLGIGSPERM